MFSLGDLAAPVAATRPTDTISGGYTLIPQKFYHPNASRNALGLVGGNEVSLVSGNIVDLESDLLGITRSASKAPQRQYQPACPLGGPGQRDGTGVSALGGVATNGPSSIAGSCPAWPQQLVFTERSTGRVATINTAPRHLPTTQYVSYPGVPAPDPFRQEVYGAPWRF